VGGGNDTVAMEGVGDIFFDAGVDTLEIVNNDGRTAEGDRTVHDFDTTSDLITVPAGTLAKYTVTDGGADGLYLLHSAGTPPVVSIALVFNGLTPAQIASVTDRLVEAP
jgi:hypothetical protein